MPPYLVDVTAVLQVVSHPISRISGKLCKTVNSAAPFAPCRDTPGEEKTDSNQTPTFAADGEIGQPERALRNRMAVKRCLPPVMFPLDIGCLRSIMAAKARTHTCAHKPRLAAGTGLTALWGKALFSFLACVAYTTISG